MCDNIAVVEVLTFGRTRDSAMVTCARNIWLLSAMFNVNIIVSHIRVLDNTVADLISRWCNTDHVVKLHSLVDPCMG